MSREIRTADEVIEMIAEVLNEADGQFIEDIANKIVSARVEYIEDSLFEVTYSGEDEEDEDE